MKIFNSFLRFQYAMLILFSITSNSVVFSQSYQRDFTPKSPEASAFNKYGDIGVNYFTGSPNISYPLGLSEEVPMSISYNSTGVKPEERSTWVGTNWNLNVGGMISRIKRGFIDEIRDPNISDDFSYLNNKQRLNGAGGSTWDDLPLTVKTDIAAKTSTNSTTRAIANADLEPDEFVFNFNGMSGSFLLNHKGEWVFRGNNPSEFRITNVEILNDINIHFSISSSLTISGYPRAIMGFTIQASDGTEYCFGGDESAIDFSFNLPEQLKNDPDFNIKIRSSLASVGWHLVKIKYTSGKETSFTYEKDEFTVAGNVTRNIGITRTKRGNAVSPIAFNDTIDTKTFSYMSSSYLKEITTAYEVIKFEKIQLLSTDIADYPYDYSTMININFNHHKWFKLNKIQTFKKPYSGISQQPLKEYRFDYGKSQSNRLQLSKIREMDVNDLASTAPKSITHFEFAYNNSPGLLPQYQTAMIDHWGYYNGNGMLNNISITPGNESEYQNLRKPDSTYMKNEILQKVTYPTGGFTSFVFEAHDYSASVPNVLPINNTGGNNPYPSVAETSIKTAGGVRIQSIKNSDGTNVIEKTYLYKKNIASTVSSGILASVPTYFDNFVGSIGDINVLEHAFMNEQSLNNIHTTNGSPVTYSEVIEKNQDGSYTIYKFSNYDSLSYCNRTVLRTKTRANTTLINPKRDPVIDLEHLRGRLLEQCAYSYDNKILKKVKNEYTTTLDTAQAVRIVASSQPVTVKAVGGPDETELRASSYYIHMAPVFLNKSTTTSYYSETSPATQIAIVTENSYDSRKNLTKQKVIHIDDAEKKSNITTDYFYAYDPNNTTNLVPIDSSIVSESIIGVKQQMLDKFMIGIPLQTKNNFNKGTKVEFGAYDGSGILITSLVANTNYTILPYIHYSQNKLGTFTEQFKINSYTDYDKPKQTQSKGTNSATATTIVNYVWSNGLLISKSIDTAPNVLKWEFNWDINKRLLLNKKDENGLLMKFTYDGYRRLKQVDDRYKSADITGTKQSTVEYDYIYRDVVNGIPHSYIETKKWFRGVTNATPNTDKIVTKQFIDGLGRPISVVKEYYTPSQQHQKTYVLYDNLGRQDKVYQPIQSSTLGVDANLSSVLSGKPYIQTLYEASPLSRPLTQIMEDGKKVETRYSTNGTNEVRAFKVTLGRVDDNRLVTVEPETAPNDYYAANTLSKTIIWDENGTTNQTTLVGRFVGRTEVFKDKLDRVILTRKFVKNVSGTFVPVDTYNIYDIYGNLVMVIPPDGVSTSVNYALAFQYVYDNLYRLIEKKVPGAKPVKFYYNDRDQLVLMQDGNMRNPSYGNTSNTGAGNAFGRKYIATFYDRIGRPTRAGFTGASFPTLTPGQDFEVTEAHIVNRLTSTEFYRRDINGTINPNDTFSTNWVKNQETKVLKNTSVPTLREYVWSYIERRVGYEYTGNPIWSGKHHLLCTTKRYGWMDVGDVPIDDNDYGGVDWRVSAWNGAQMPDYSLHYNFSSNYAQEVRTADYNTYDHALRMTKLDHAFSKGGDGLSAPTNISNMVYNFKDQLTEKNLGYNSNYNKYLQSIDYVYNTRGWLTNINTLSIDGTSQQQMQIMTPQSPSNGTIQNLAITPFINRMVNDLVIPYKNADAETMTAINDDNPDLYSQTILYDNPDSRFGSPDAQYNGNISNTYWRVAGRAIQGYGFKYDDLNRLTEGNYYDVTTGYTTQPIFEAGKFTEKVTEYDLRGNIKKLQRFGFKESVMNTNNDVVGNYGEIDNLNYTYDLSNPNRIQTITDGTSAAHLTKGFKYNNATSSAYTYDDNGNMISDPNKGLTISYNYLNLPETITMPSGDGHIGVIQFVYDASGQKHRRIVKKLVSGANGVITTDLKITDYVGGYEYEVTNPIPDNGVSLSPANSLPSRIHHAEGAITVEAGSNTYQYEFALRDHLGNTRVTFKDKNNDASIDFSNIDPSANEISQINHYYPFGLNMEGNWNGQNGANKYQFNGKELNDDFGLGLSDYGARFYDAAIGRFNSIDNHSDDYLSNSAYNYVLNNPINMIDPDGQDAIFTITRDKNGDINGITIKTVVFIKGSGASDNRAKELNAAAKNILKSSSANGVMVSFVVNYEYDNNKKQNQLKEGENILEFSDKKGDTHVQGGQRESGQQEIGDFGTIYKDEHKDNVAIVHETLHLLGLSDRYDSPDRKTVKTHKGFGNDIMGKRDATQINYTHYHYYSLFAKSAKSNFLWKPVDRDSKGKLLPYVPNPNSSPPNKKK